MQYQLYQSNRRAFALLICLAALITIALSFQAPSRAAGKALNTHALDRGLAAEQQPTGPHLLGANAGPADLAVQNGRIAFHSDSKTYFWTMSPEGNCRLGAFSGADVAWSPDGKRIALTNYSLESPDIIVMDADGSNVTPIAGSPWSHETSPAWSPGGETIAFTSYKDGNAEIYLINPDGNNRMQGIVPPPLHPLDNNLWKMKTS